jgi:hypothetical protein
MIISHTHKFIFVKTRKTAGTSIEAFLSKQCGPEDILTPVLPKVEGHAPRNFRGLFNPLKELRETRNDFVGTKRVIRHFVGAQRFYNHMPARTIRDRLPEDIWNSYFKFCVERNPWDKTLSHFHMVNARSNEAMLFDEYIESRRFPIDADKYMSKCDELIVDAVIKFEQLSEDLDKVFSSLGIEFDGDLGVRAKAGYRSDTRPYTEVFNEQQIDIVAECFAREIAMHSYRF